MPQQPSCDMARWLVAYLASSGHNGEKMDQAKIAKFLHLSPSTINRYWKDCLEGPNALLKISLSHALTSDQIDAVHKFIFPNEIEDSMRRRFPSLQSINVFGAVQEPVAFKRDTTEKRPLLRWEARAQQLGEVIATVLRDLILSSGSLGVPGRFTMFWALEGLRKLRERTPWERSGKVQFIPLWGHAYKFSESDPESPWISHEQLSASSICSGLNKLFNPDGSLQKSIDGFPLILPLKWADNERKIASFVDDLSELSPSYREVVSAMETMRGALVPVGTPLQENRFWSEECFKQAGFTAADRKLFLTNLHGDVGGIPVLKPDLSKSENEKTLTLVRRVEQCWLGVKKTHLQVCAKAAREHTNRLGVVLIACGKERSRIVYEVIRAALCNRLIIDDECAQGVLELEAKDPI